MADLSKDDVGKRYIIKAKNNDKLIWEGILEKSYKAYEPGAKDSVQNAIFDIVTGPGDLKGPVNFSSSDYTFDVVSSKGGRRLRKNKRNTLRSSKTLRKNARRGTRRWR
jgi:hypothetical protein